MRHLLLTAVLLCPVLAQAVAPIEHSFNARAHVTAQGKVEAVEVATEVPAPLQAVVRQAVEALAFEPATVNGEPAASRTMVTVKLRLSEGEGGALESRLLSVSRAPVRMQPPRYPPQALRDAISGRVILDLAVLPDGTVDVANSRVDSLQGGRGSRGAQAGKEMSAAALEAAASWQVFVEDVAGVPQPTRLLTPVTFCANRGARPGDCPALKHLPPAEQRVAVDPAVRLAQVVVPAGAGDAES